MRVRVEEAVHEDLLQRQLRAATGEHARIQAGGAQRREVGDRDHVHVFEREHVPRGHVAEDLRHVDRVVAGELAGEPLEVGGFGREIQLALDHAAELLDDPAGTVHTPAFDVSLDERGQVQQDLEVDVDHRLDVRPLHLHNHVLAVEAGRPMDLPDGGRRDRRGVKVAEQRVERALQVGLDDLANLLERERRHVLLKLG